MTVPLNLLYIGRMTPRASEYLSGTKPPVRIAVDMDEVIADYFGEQVARYESWSGAAVISRRPKERGYGSACRLSTRSLFAGFRARRGSSPTSRSSGEAAMHLRYFAT